MRLKDIRLKWRLLVISVVLVTAPTILLGFLSYNIFRNETFKAQEGQLSSISRNWAIITQAYIEEMDRVLRREDVLVRQRLISITLGFKKIVEILYEINGVPSQKTVASLYQKTAAFKIGRSGFVFLLDKDGRFLTPQGRMRDSGYFFSPYDTISESERKEIYKKIARLKNEETYELRYNSADDAVSKPRMKLAVFSYYEPQNIIIGTCSYYTDFKSYELEKKLQEELRDKISKEKIGAHGYIWVMNSKGEGVVTKDGLRNGENLWNVSDSKGERVTQKLIRQARALALDKTAMRYYFWKDLSENAESARLSALSYVPAWDWIIGVTAYESDFLQGLQAIKLAIFLVCFIFIVVGSLVAFTFTLSISRPIEKLTELSIKAAQGNLDVDVGLMVGYGGEVGSLAQSFNAMVINLRKKIQEVQFSSSEMHKINIQLEKTSDELEVRNHELFLEISERKRAEERSEERERFLDRVFSGIQDGISVLDPELNILRVNYTMEKWYAHARPFIGKKCHEVFHGRTSPCEDCPSKRALETAQTSSTILPMTGPDGAIVGWFDLYAFPILDNATGKVKGVIEYVRDITQRKNAENDLLMAYSQLKETQSQLTQTAKMAAIGQLASGVAHEINNPLTGVLNNVQLIKMASDMHRDFSPEEYRALLNTIEESALRCKKITQSLLDFSHASKGAMHLVSLNTAIDEVLMLIMHEMKLSAITLEKNCAADLPLIKGDMQLLQQSIFDILTNAQWAIQKKSGREGGVIRIRTELSSDKKTVNLFISDTGIGILQENLQRIFEPFFTTKTVGDGTGLGLSIVYSIIKGHQGSISVESQIGQGATFKISLPVQDGGVLK